MSSPFTLYVWPQEWNLPTIDPSCLAAVFYLQLTLAGQFSICECLNPDDQLPILRHDQNNVSSLPSIIKYICDLPVGSFPNANLDVFLNSTQKPQKTAWTAHVESDLGNLVAHTFYAVHENWMNLTHSTLAYMLPVPQRYYVPSRIREMHQDRLVAAGLWSSHGVKQSEKQPFKESLRRDEKANAKDGFARAFEIKKFSEKACLTFDLYARLLGNNRFVYRDRPATLDLLLAAHVLLLTTPPFPDPLLKTLLRESYPTLVSHAENILDLFSQSSSPDRTSSPNSPLWSLLPLIRTKVERGLIP